MTEPILASTLSGGTGPQAFDLTILDNLKSYLFPAGSPSNIDDNLLQRMISSASQAIQSKLGYDVQSGQKLAATSYTEMLDTATDGFGWPGLGWVYPVPIRFPPIQSVVSVTIDGLTIPSNGDSIKTPGWFVDSSNENPFIVYVAGYKPMPRGKKNITVVYSGGWPAIPYDVEQACLETVALRYKRKDRIDVRSLSMAGESTTFLTGDIPDSALSAIQPYKRITVT